MSILPISFFSIPVSLAASLNWNNKLLSLCGHKIRALGYYVPGVTVLRKGLDT